MINLLPESEITHDIGESDTHNIYYGTYKGVAFRANVFYGAKYKGNWEESSHFVDTNSISGIEEEIETILGLGDEDIKVLRSALEKHAAEDYNAFLASEFGSETGF